MPFWSKLDDIPYSSMWPDDQIWLPLMLEEQTFLGRFVFDQDTMLDYLIVDDNGTPVDRQPCNARRQNGIDREQA